MKPINICITVFNRYDLLARLILSIRGCILRPGRVRNIYLIDRGNDRGRVRAALDGTPANLVHLPGQSLPAAWNWFMDNVPEERIITSDDIEFYPEALEAFASHPGQFVGLEDGKSSQYACFMIRDELIQKIGLFDEDISPNYMYFEDCDYAYRMKLAGLETAGIACMKHGLAQSWERKTDEQRNEHHGRFLFAQANYVRKWGGLPGHETFTTPFNVAVGQTS